MAQDATEMVVAKGGHIYFAPAGTTLPADTNARAALTGFEEAGFVTNDGVALSGNLDLLEILSWGVTRPTRREAQRRDFSLAFALQQWNSDNLALAFGGGSAAETSAGVTRYDFPADEDALDTVSIVVDWEDQGYDHRMVWERGNVTEGVETSLVSTDGSVLPITYSVLNPDVLTVPGFYVTDSPAFNPVS